MAQAEAQIYFRFRLNLLPVQTQSTSGSDSIHFRFRLNPLPVFTKANPLPVVRDAESNAALSGPMRSTYPGPARVMGPCVSQIEHAVGRTAGPAETRQSEVMKRPLHLLSSSLHPSDGQSLHKVVCAQCARILTYTHAHNVLSCRSRVFSSQKASLGSAIILFFVYGGNMTRFARILGFVGHLGRHGQPAWSDVFFCGRCVFAFFWVTTDITTRFREFFCSGRSSPKSNRGLFSTLKNFSRGKTSLCFQIWEGAGLGLPKNRLRVSVVGVSREARAPKELNSPHITPAQFLKKRSFTRLFFFQLNRAPGTRLSVQNRPLCT